MIQRKTGMGEVGAGFMIPIMVMITITTVILAGFLSREMSRQELQRVQVAKSQGEVAATHLADRVRTYLQEKFDAYMVEGDATALGQWGEDGWEAGTGWFGGTLKSSLKADLGMINNDALLYLKCTEEDGQDCTRDRRKTPKRLVVTLSRGGGEASRVVVEDVLMIGRPNFSQFAIMVGNVNGPFFFRGLQLSGPIAVQLGPSATSQIVFRDQVSTVTDLYVNKSFAAAIDSIDGPTDFLRITGTAYQGYDVGRAFQALKSGIEEAANAALPPLVSHRNASRWLVRAEQNNGVDWLTVTETRYQYQNDYTDGPPESDPIIE